MKEHEHEQILIEYRLTEARESLAEAKMLLREKMSNRSVMNRLYYAMFYAVLAVLQGKQISASKHSGVIAAFDREFVKNMIFDKTFSKVLLTALKEPGMIGLMAPPEGFFLGFGAGSK